MKISTFKEALNALIETYGKDYDIINLPISKRNTVLKTIVLELYDLTEVDAMNIVSAFNGYIIGYEIGFNEGKNFLFEYNPKSEY